MVAKSMTLQEKERKSQVFRRRGDHYQRREAIWGFLFTLPAILGFFLWQFGPMVANIAIGFTDWQIINDPEWIGWDNYTKLLRDDRLFIKSAQVTVTYTLMSVPLSILFAFGLAVLLNQKIRGLPFFRTVFYLPSIVPVVASSFLWLWLFNPDFGLLNALLRPLGFPKLQWIFSSSTVLPSLTLMSLWGIGGMMIIFLAGLQGIPDHLYEAVDIDGGNRWHKLWYVTAPLMTPVIFFNFILSMISTLQTFTQGYIVTEGGPNNASLFYNLYLYRKAFSQLQMGYASAQATILFIVIGVMTFFIFRTSGFWVFYEGDR